MKPKSLVVAGVMSGTSADGVDVALCRIGPSSPKDGTPRVKLIGAAGFPYPKPLRSAVLAAMDAKAISVAEMSRLNWRFGEVYADAVESAARQFGVKVGLVGCHGQTIYHQGAPSKYLGSDVRCTWQIGEASVIAERLRVPVVSDFRPADLAAGGQGAPLVPMLDFVLFRSHKMSRVLQNLGGIANMTAIPAGALTADVLAFDSGPSNMVIDACMTQLFGKAFDRNGTVREARYCYKAGRGTSCCANRTSLPLRPRAADVRNSARRSSSASSRCAARPKPARWISSPLRPRSRRSRFSMPIAGSSGLTSGRGLRWRERRVCRRGRRRKKCDPDGNAARRA